jgi:hypothetical protein
MPSTKTLSGGESVSEQIVVGPRDKANVLEKLKNGQLKVKHPIEEPKRYKTQRLKGRNIDVKGAVITMANAAAKSNEGKAAKQENKKTSKAEKKAEKTAQMRKTRKFSDEQLIQAVKDVGHPATSREISDKLGIADPDVGRALIRREMERLIKDGKIVAEEPKEGRAKKLYKVA